MDEDYPELSAMKSEAGTASFIGVDLPRPRASLMSLENGLAVVFGLAGVFAAGLGLVLIVWGGTNDAHERCLAHRFGDESVLSTTACVVAR